MPAEDSALTIRNVLKHWRDKESEVEQSIKDDVLPIVERIWKHFNLIQRSENTESTLKIQRRILLVKLYIDYQRIQFAIRSGQLIVESTSRQIEGKAMVTLKRLLLTIGLFIESVGDSS